ncbi:hypothetical protein CEE36_02490 [candidate division TA06 bacterium B3_TA06]|uniref:DUF4760 domain-containing protein n=1 Tax=candidate division TA06 bacterium B3_TA06 TaxID=2012487 RepID=A0A532VA10_UNCT6|nr:MAG: hypothetical protein CEE36_02490 [candidate division TA06 bacterium B3_TA06]
MNLTPLAVILSLAVIASSVVSVLTFLFGVLPQRRVSKLDAVIKYFQQGETVEAKGYRKRIYHSEPDRVDVEAASMVIGFFHFWGLMVKRKLLPIWVFDSISGYRVVQLYGKLEKHISNERKKAAEYAEHFVWLAEEIKRRFNIEVQRPQSP